MALDPGDYLILAAIVKASTPDELPLEDLANSTGLSKRTIIRRLKVLRLHGLIASEKVGGRYLSFEVRQNAHVVLNNMGVPYAAS